VDLEVSADYVYDCLSPKGKRRSWKVLRAAADMATKNKAATTRKREELKRIGA
jgi:hypothetical protein